MVVRKRNVRRLVHGYTCDTDACGNAKMLTDLLTLLLNELVVFFSSLGGVFVEDNRNICCVILKSCKLMSNKSNCVHVYMKANVCIHKILRGFFSICVSNIKYS